MLCFRRTLLLLGVLLLTGCTGRPVAPTGSLALASAQPSATAPAPPQAPAPADTATAVRAATEAAGPAATASAAPAPTAAVATLAPAPPAGWQRFTSRLHGYTLDYPAGWTLEIQNPGTSGGDAENVSMHPSSGGQPVLRVYANKSTAPITGYENCVKNLHIWDVDVCSLSFRGQWIASSSWCSRRAGRTTWLASITRRKISTRP